MLRRTLGSLLVAGLLVTGAAGCSSDGSDGADTETETEDTSATADESTTTAGDDATEATDAPAEEGSGGGGTTSENADVQAYCDAVEDFVAKAKDAGSDPDKVQEISEEGQELTKQAGELATSGLSAEDAQAISDCTSEATDALMPG